MVQIFVQVFLAHNLKYICLHKKSISLHIQSGQHFFIHNPEYVCTFLYTQPGDKFFGQKSKQNVFVDNMKQFCESSAIFAEKINVWANLHIRGCLFPKLNRFLSHFISTLAKVFAKYQHIFNIIAFRITSIITNTIFYIFTNSIILITIIMSSAKPSHAVVFYYLEIPFSVG